jgi:hypothetical protein
MYNFPIDISTDESARASKMPSLTEKQTKQINALDQKLEQLRDISNVIQALENVVSQCRNVPLFSGLQRYAQYQMDDLQKSLRRQIHS